MRKLLRTKRLFVSGITALFAVGCGGVPEGAASEAGGDGIDSDDVTQDESSSSEEGTDAADLAGDVWDGDEEDGDEGDDDDEGETGTTDPGDGCNGAADRYCQKIDLLFVIDNSGTMGEEQLNLAKNFPLLIEKLRQLKTSGSTQKEVTADINLMVTSTDMGHPICTPFEPEDYDPLHGRPNSTTCRDRLGDFTTLGKNPSGFEHACTNYCPAAEVEPSDPFIRFISKGAQSNVNDDRIEDALSCIGPQGVNGCGYEAPLESMMQALYPKAPWNDPEIAKKPFLRDDATLAVVIMTDEADCSVQAPSGYAYFTDQTKDQFWEIDPATETKKPSSAICWNAGVECDNNGNCQSADRGVLHPLSRYKDFLNGYIKGTGSGPNGHKEVVMLGILGVPPVTRHNDKPPYEPIRGGVYDLEYRPWQDADILPGDPASKEEKQYEFGIGPGCTGKDAMGNPTGQAIPPVRIREVCESLNFKKDKKQQVRCCIESICDEDFSSAINCLSGLIEAVIPPM